MQSPNRRKFLRTTAITIALPNMASPQTSTQPPQRRAAGGNPAHEQFIRQAIELAASARKNGNHPFGALLADETGRVILTAENTALTTHDPTRHAELNLVQLACAKIPSDALAKAILLHQHRTVCHVLRRNSLGQNPIGRLRLLSEDLRQHRQIGRLSLPLP